MKGLLWFDSDPRRTIAEKVTAAAVRFVEKFGCSPDTCYVSNKSLDCQQVIQFGTGQIRLLPSSNILVNHFWIGCEIA